MNRSTFRLGFCGGFSALKLGMLAFFSLALASAQPSTAQAQQATRRAVAAGEVSGLELGIEGSLQAVPGGKMRFLIALHEVVRQRDLRPAPGAQVRVVTSFRRDRPVAEVVTDANGRAEVLFDVPADTDSNGFHVTFDARSPRHIRRRFDIDVSAVGDSRIEVAVDRTRVAPGSPIRAFGRVLSRITGRPLANAEVSVIMQNGNGPFGAAHVVRTGLTGAFGTTFTAPREPTTLSVQASHSGALLVRADRLVEVATDAEPALVIRAAPERNVLEAPGNVRVDVYVRTGSGRPVAGAQVVVGAIPRARPGEPVPVLPTTAADGHAIVPWTIRAADVPAGAVVDVEAPVRVVRTGVAAAEGTVRVRIARVSYATRVVVEGGALAPGLPSRLFVQVVSADGAPAPGVDVQIESARFGAALTARTDAAGFAALEATLARELADAAPDACGGATALAVTVSVLGARASSDELCLPVDPDATLRVRATRNIVSAGADVEADVSRGPTVSRSAVVVTLLSLAPGVDGNADALIPLAFRVLPAGTTRVALRVPAETTGTLVIRARALVALSAAATLEEVRGGSTVVLATSGATFSTSLTRDADGALRLSADGPRGARSVLAVALPETDARALAERLRALDGPLVAALRTEPASELRFGAALAARTPHDLGAPAVLRDGQVLAVPASEDPVSLGVLRDPSRARARFVAGRLALVLRALENYVASRVPDAMEDVSVRSPRGWAFNREILDAVTGAEEFGPEGARGLDGLPLTIDALGALDPSLTYDRMARRITRRRLFNVLVALRLFAREHDLDLAWAWRGDPQTWLPRLLGVTDENTGEDSVSRADLFDGWGHPFVVRPAPGGRPRFGMIAPVLGYEVVSVGPDGRAGTSDDVWDPLARVLASGGVYATAVDEDAFVARASGVELGRATIESLNTLFENDEGATYGSDVDENVHGSAELPAPLAAIDASAFEPHGTSRGAGVGPIPMPEGALRLALSAPDEPRRFVVVAQTLAADGGRAITSLAVPPGTPVIIDAQLPARLRVGEALTVPITVAALTGAVHAVRITVDATGPVSAQFAPTNSGAQPDGRLTLGNAGDTKTLSIVLTARAATGADARRATIRVTVSGAGMPTRTVSKTISVDDGSVARFLSRAGLVRTPTDLTIELPDDARDVEAVLVIAPPDALALDPVAANLLRVDPALLAWAETLAGRTPTATMGAELRAALLSARGTDGSVTGDAPLLSTACALVTWSAAAPGDSEALSARRQASNYFTNAEGAYGDADVQAGAQRLRAATLAALAAGASGSFPGLEGASDPIAQRVAMLREDLRATLATHRRAPGVLARASAALLLADPRDMQARAMFELAARALVERRGRTFLPRLAPRVASTGTADDNSAETDVNADELAGEDPGEDIAGTAALALAAHQIGNAELLARLRPFVANRAERALRAGGEATFWTLAASAYGAFGQPPLVVSEGADLVANMSGTNVPLTATPDTHGVIRVALPRPSGSEVRVSLTPTAGAPPRLARLEVSYGRPTTARADAPMRLTLNGDAGYAGESSAFEVLLESTSNSPIESPVLEIALPAAARADAEIRATLARAPGVASVEEPDTRGLLRVHLTTLSAGEHRTIPLAVAWTARGRVSGFALVAYDATRPDRMTILPPRTIVLAPRPEGRLERAATGH